LIVLLTANVNYPIGKKFARQCIRYDWNPNNCKSKEIFMQASNNLA